MRGSVEAPARPPARGRSPPDVVTDANGAGGERRRRPIATYRAQMHAGFTFDDAAAIAGYLRDLGVSHLYLSPVLKAAPGSTHGYDVVDPSQVNPELGGEAAHERLSAALGRVGLAQLLDVVPNHMAITGRDNRWWWDVLRNGPSSRWARYFDVDWEGREGARPKTVLLAILGDHYGRELEAARWRPPPGGSPPAGRAPSWSGWPAPAPTSRRPPATTPSGSPIASATATSSVLASPSCSPVTPAPPPPSTRSSRPSPATSRPWTPC